MGSENHFSIETSEKFCGPRSFCSICFGCIGIILLSIGIGLFVTETEKRKFYMESSCLVTDSWLVERSCSEKNCWTDSDGNRHCDTYYYTCFALRWEVTYGIGEDQHGEPTYLISVISESTTYDYYSSAIRALNKRGIGFSFSCWFDSRGGSEDSVQWSRPDPIVGLVLLIVGATFAFFVFLCCCAVKVIPKCWTAMKNCCGKDDYLYPQSKYEYEYETQQQDAINEPFKGEGEGTAYDPYKPPPTRPVEGAPIVGGYQQSVPPPTVPYSSFSQPNQQQQQQQYMSYHQQQAQAEGQQYGGEGMAPQQQQPTSSMASGGRSLVSGMGYNAPPPYENQDSMNDAPPAYKEDDMNKY